MNKFLVIYEENKKLDLMFEKLYSNCDMVRKNKLELLVEIGELANETKCFKYWSEKKMEIKKVEEEYADCIIMTLCFFNYLKMDLNNLIQDKMYYDNVDTFFKLYELAVEFSKNEDTDTLVLLFNTLIKLGYNLGFDDDKIVSICLNKINRDKERFQEGF